MAQADDDRVDARFTNELELLVRSYLCTADAGPRGRPGIEQLYVLDERARRLLDKIETVRRARRGR